MGQGKLSLVYMAAQAKQQRNIEIDRDKVNVKTDQYGKAVFNLKISAGMPGLYQF